MSKNTARARQRDRFALGAGAALAVLFLALSFPRAEIELLAWCALVPLLLVLARAQGRSDWFILWATGQAFGTIGFFWMRHVTWVGTFALGFYISIYFVLFCVSVRWLSYRWRLPLALGAPLAWTALEYLRGVFLGGLPWLFLAHTQYRQLSVIQIADLTGTPGVTFWLVAVNGALADAFALLLRRDTPLSGDKRPLAARPRAVLAGVAFVLAFSVAAQAYGLYRLNTIIINNGPRIAVVQGNIPQEVKNLMAAEDADTRFNRLNAILATHVELTRAAQSESPTPELVIWPETMAPPGLFDQDYEDLCRQFVAAIEQRKQLGRWDSPEQEKRLLHELRNVRREIEHYDNWRRLVSELQTRSHLLIGAGRYGVRQHGQGYEIDHYNSVYFLRRGEVGVSGRYDKIHLVPFGEYVPLRGLTGWLVNRVVPGMRDLEAGSEHTLFEVGGWRFAPTICFEDAFPALVADFGRGSERMDFIVNVTNEGWFKDGAELDEHLAIGVFRAVECRVGLVRAANTGISAFIAPSGRVVSKLVVEERDREVCGVLHGVATTSTAKSPYLRVGEMFGKLCLLGWILSMLLAAVGRIRGYLKKGSQ